jgi:hypothetical protein
VGQCQADPENFLLDVPKLSFLSRRVIASGHLGFDPLHHAGAGAALAGGPENAFAARQLCTNCRFLHRIDPRSTDRLAALGPFVSRPGKSGVYPFLNDCALELGKYAEHLKERPPCWGGCINRLLFEIEVAPNSVEFAEKTDEILQRSAKPVYRPGGDDIDLAPDDLF